MLKLTNLFTDWFHGGQVLFSQDGFFLCTTQVLYCHCTFHLLVYLHQPPDKMERREGRRKGGREGGREEGRKGGREKGREKGRKGGREKGRKGGREGGRKGGREGGTSFTLLKQQLLICTRRQ